MQADVKDKEILTQKAVLADSPDSRSFTIFRHKVRNIFDLDLSVKNYSPLFEVQKLNWVIAFKTILGDYDETILSMHINCKGPVSVTHPMVYVEAELSIINQKYPNHVMKKEFATCMKVDGNASYGYKDFMFWDDIISPDEGFMENDSFIIEIKMAATPPQPLAILNKDFSKKPSHNISLHRPTIAIGEKDVIVQVDNLSLQERGEYLLKTGLDNNCTFLVGKDDSEQKQFAANSLFLARVSPVFERMFYGQFVESSPVLVPDVQPDAFYKMLRYAYTSKLQLNSQEEAAEMYHVADKYLISDLKEACIQRLQPSNETDIWVPWQIAEFYNIQPLQTATLEIVSQCIHKVLERPEFLYMNYRNLLTLVQMYNLPVNSELEFFSAVLRWARAQCAHKGLLPDGPTLRNELGDAIHFIRFLAMTSLEFSGEPVCSGILTPEEQLVYLLAIIDPLKHLPPTSLCALRSPRGPCF